MAKKSSSNLGHLALKRSTPNFKKEIETRKKKLISFFLKIKKYRFLEKLRGFEDEHRKGIEKVGAADFCNLCFFMLFRRST